MLRRALGVAAVLAAAMTADGAEAVLPSDPLATGWTYDSINLPAAWDLSTGSPSVGSPSWTTGAAGRCRAR